MALSSTEHPQVVGDGTGVVNGLTAPTQSSTQKAASHLIRWAPLMVSAGFFWCWERLPWSALMLEVRVAFFRGECWSMA